MRKLFVSFTALLRALKDGAVTDNDLAAGLFYFGCARQHAFDPSGQSNEMLRFFKDQPDQGLAIHAKLVAALLLGESEGRVIWRDEKGRQSYEQVNNLLMRNGFAGITYHYDGRSTNIDYCYPGVKDRVKEAGLPLEVIR